MSSTQGQVAQSRRDLGRQLTDVISEMQRVQTDIDTLISWYDQYWDCGGADDIKMVFTIATDGDQVFVDLPSLSNLGKIGRDGFNVYEFILKQAKTYYRQLDNQRIMLAKKLAT